MSDLQASCSSSRQRLSPTASQEYSNKRQFDGLTHQRGNVWLSVRQAHPGLSEIPR